HAGDVLDKPACHEEAGRGDELLARTFVLESLLERHDVFHEFLVPMPMPMVIGITDPLHQALLIGEVRYNIGIEKREEPEHLIGSPLFFVCRHKCIEFVDKHFMLLVDLGHPYRKMLFPFEHSPEPPCPWRLPLRSMPITFYLN